MEYKESVKKNFIMNAILSMSSFLFPLISFPYASRVLLPVGTGKVSFATSLISYFSMFAQLGIPTYGIRACAKVRDNKEDLTRTVHELILINLFMNIITYFVLIMSVIFVPKLQDDKLLYFVISFNIILTSLGMEWLYKALEKYTYIAIRSMVFKLVALVAMFLLVHEQSDYVIYAGITIFASSASNVLNCFKSHKYIELRPVGNYDIKKHLKPVGIFFAMACATTIYTHLDVVMLGFMTTDLDVGYYHAAVRIKTILVSIVTSLGAVLLPRASYYVQKGNFIEFEKISEKALKFILLMATPLSVYFMLFARYGVYLLSGQAYEGAILPMQIIMPSLLFIGITNITGIQILVPMGCEKKVLISVILGAIVDIVVNIFLIPYWFASGAALGTLLAEFIVMIAQYMALGPEVRKIIKNIQYRNIIIGIIIGSLLSFWVTFLKLSNFHILFISAILFFGGYLTYLLIVKESYVYEIVCKVFGCLKKKNHR